MWSLHILLGLAHTAGLLTGFISSMAIPVDIRRILLQRNGREGAEVPHLHLQDHTRRICQQVCALVLLTSYERSVVRPHQVNFLFFCSHPRTVPLKTHTGTLLYKQSHTVADRSEWQKQREIKLIYQPF